MSGSASKFPYFEKARYFKTTQAVLILSSSCFLCSTSSFWILLTTHQQMCKHKVFCCFVWATVMTLSKTASFKLCVSIVSRQHVRCQDLQQNLEWLIASNNCKINGALSITVLFFVFLRAYFISNQPLQINCTCGAGAAQRHVLRYLFLWPFSVPAG